MPEKLEKTPLPQGFFTQRAFKAEMERFLENTKASEAIGVQQGLYLISDTKGNPLTDTITVDGEHVDAELVCAYGRNSVGELVVSIYYRTGNELLDADIGTSGNSDEIGAYLANAGCEGFLRMDGGQIRAAIKKGLSSRTENPLGYLERVKTAREEVGTTFTKVLGMIEEDAEFEKIRANVLSALELHTRIPESGTTIIDKAAYPRIEIRNERRIRAGARITEGQDLGELMVPSISIFVHLGDHSEYAISGGPEYVRHWHETLATLAHEIKHIEKEDESTFVGALKSRGIQQVTLSALFDSSGLGKGKEGVFSVPLASAQIPN